ncbi:MAG: T9SS type A sorting domain-containing protein [Candidatus Kapabacteria bacterium]|nr:T9SS type A sorting domain-containing protein [Candidatus Kapabacteria bacterium]
MSAYPYVIGPTYYGVVVTDNFPVRGPGAASTNVKITESVTTYTPNSSTPVVLFTSTAVMTGKQGVLYVYDAKASSNTADPITFNLKGGPVGMVIDTATGRITWTSPVMGLHNVSIVAKITSSGKVYTATQTYALTIASNAPVTITFTSAPITVGTENIPYTYTVRATVSDTSKRLAYRFQDSVAGMTLSRQGVLAWQKPVVGTYPISVRAIVIGDTVVSLQSFTLVIKPDSTTGVDDVDSPLSTATVYPNPANDILIVQLTTPLVMSARVELLDLSGRSVQQTTINQGSTMCFMDVQTVYAGVYIVRITLGSNSLSYPVVISE